MKVSHYEILMHELPVCVCVCVFTGIVEASHIENKREDYTTEQYRRYVHVLVVCMV